MQCNKSSYAEVILGANRFTP